MLSRKKLHDLRCWLLGLPRNKHWRLNAVASSLKWGVNFLLVYFVVSRLGHGFVVNTSVSLAMDGLMYAVNRLIWRNRKASTGNSALTAFVWWLCFCGINAGLMWLMIDPADLRISTAKVVLAPVGIALNPLVFWINDKVAFQSGGLRRLMRAVRVA